MSDRRFQIQIQPARSQGLDLDETLARLQEACGPCEVTVGIDDGPYVNVEFTTADPVAIWEQVQRVIGALPGLRRASMVMCTGKQSWDDYLLLHHFDATLVLDQLEQHAP